MKKKGIIIGLVFIALLAISTKPVYAYYEQKQEEKRLAQDPFFTEYKLSWDELDTMVSAYHVLELVEEPYRYAELDKKPWPDYSYYTMEATEKTEIVVAVLNYYLFDNLRECDEAGREKATEYGFSSENRITVDWVMTHPKEAADIMDAMWEHGYLFCTYSDIKEIYDEEVKGHIIE